MRGEERGCRGKEWDGKGEKGGKDCAKGEEGRVCVKGNGQAAAVSSGSTMLFHVTTFHLFSDCDISNEEKRPKKEIVEEQ
jgi:hypothetical protein